MNADPRAALEVLTAAFERHLEACSARRGDDDASVIAASNALADAFEEYDDALLAAYDEMTPLVILDEEVDDEEYDDDEYEDDDEDGPDASRDGSSHRD